MGVKAFFLEDRTNLLAGVGALALFVAGGVALLQQRGVASVFLLLAGFLAAMFLEYKNIDQPD